MEDGLDSLADAAYSYVFQNFTEDNLESVLDSHPEIDIKKYISHEDALTIVQSNDNWLTDVQIDNPDDIAQLITFDNSHLVARSLYLEDPTAARALREELSYWCKDD